MLAQVAALKQPAQWLASAMLCVTALAVPAETRLPAISQPINPQSPEECEQLDNQWHQRYNALYAEAGACSSKARPYTGLKKPVWMPNCGYDTGVIRTECASIQDQVCATGKQWNQAVQQCRSALAANQRRIENEQSTLAKAKAELERIDAARQAYVDITTKGPVNAAIDHAADSFQGAVKEAARTSGLPGADAYPVLNDVGAASDKAFREVPGNAAAKELALQSAAAARARMADALFQLEGAIARYSNSVAPAGPSASPSPTPFAGATPAPSQTLRNDTATLAAERARIREELDREERIRRQEEDEAAERGRAQLEMMRQLNEAATQTLQRMRPAAPGVSSRTSPEQTPQQNCRPREVVCTRGGDPYCTSRPVCEKY